MIFRKQFSQSFVSLLSILVSIFGSVLVLVSCKTEDGSTLNPELVKRLGEVLDDKVQEFGVPGALVGVWIPGEGNSIIESGVSDIGSEKPIAKEDHVRVGSVTKSFTVTVILQLVDEGLISLNDPLNKFFPEIENSTATIGELANMRSGIFNYTEDGDFVDELFGNIPESLLREWAPQELVEVADRNLSYFPPDGGWHYSNTNTVLLGMVIEQITGRFVGDEIHDRIIEPLGLGGTTYPTTPDMPQPFSRGYVEVDPETGLIDVTFSDPSSSAASGAMISRLLDLRKWGEALGTGSLLNEETQRQRIDSLVRIDFDPCADDDPDRPKTSCPEYDRYGLGIGELEGWIGHTGEYIGYESLVMYEPRSGSVVVILINIFGLEEELTGKGVHLPTKIFREYAKILN